MAESGFRTRSSHSNAARGYGNDAVTRMANVAPLSGQYSEQDVGSSTVLASSSASLTNFHTLLTSAEQRPFQSSLQLPREGSEIHCFDDQATPAPPAVSLPIASSSKKRKPRSSKSGEKEKKIHICPHDDCHRGFANSGHLARHIRTHTGEKRFLCTFPECESRFSRHDNMLQHYRNHIQRNWRRRSKVSSRPATDLESVQRSPRRISVRDKGKGKETEVEPIGASASESPGSMQELVRVAGSNVLTSATSPRTSVPSSLGWRTTESSGAATAISPPEGLSTGLPLEQSVLSTSGISDVPPAALLHPWLEGLLPSPSILERPLSAAGYHFYPPADDHSSGFTTSRRPSLTHRHSYHALSAATGGEINSPVTEYGDPFAHIPRFWQSSDASTMPQYSHNLAYAAVNAYEQFPPIQSRGAFIPPGFGHHERPLPLLPRDSPVWPESGPSHYASAALAPYDHSLGQPHPEQKYMFSLPMPNLGQHSLNAHLAPGAVMSRQPEPLFSPANAVGVVASGMPAFFKGSAASPSPQTSVGVAHASPSGSMSLHPVGLGSLPRAVENSPFTNPASAMTFEPMHSPSAYTWTSPPLYPVDGRSTSIFTPTEDVRDLYQHRPFAEAAAERDKMTNVPHSDNVPR